MIRRLAFPIACGIALLVLVATYANHFHNAFHFDDSHTIENNAYIRDLANIPLFFTSPATFSALPSNQSYRPLVTATLALDYRLGGLDTFAFHVTSFTLFVVLCVLLVVLYRGLMDHARPDPLNRWIALIAATWYAVHPANAETVNYIIARSEILSTLGVVMALLLFARGGVARRFYLYLVPAALAVLSRETGAMFAPLLAVYVALFEPEIPLKDLATSFLVCFGIVGAGMRLATSYSPGGTSRWRYLLTEPFVTLHYAVSLFLPVRLSADTQWPLVTQLFDHQVLIGGAFVIAALAVAWKTSRRRETRPIGFGILWFFIALLPTSSLVPLSEPMSDHRMFFPFVGLILAVVWAVWLTIATRAHRVRTLAAAAALAVVLLMAYGTWQRNIVWHTEESLWLDATIKSPDNGRGLMNYGVIQMNKGNLAVADDYFERALQFTPNYAYLHVNLGVLKAALGRPAEAERHFREALKDDPNNPVSYTYYARWLRSIGRTEEARLLAQHAVELSPADADAQVLLATLTDSPPPNMPAPDEPSTPEGWLALSLSQCQARRYEDCIRSSEHALQLRPTYAEAYNSICAALNALGRYASAADACEHALALKPDYPPARSNLAAASAGIKK